MVPEMEICKMHNLKNQIQELEELLDLNHGQLNTEVRAAMKLKIAELKRQADQADAANQGRIAAEVDASLRRYGRPRPRDSQMLVHLAPACASVKRSRLRRTGENS